MTTPGPYNAITDIDGLQVGQAEDARARTGVTVLLAARPRSTQTSNATAPHAQPQAPGSREVWEAARLHARTGTRARGEIRHPYPL